MKLALFGTSGRTGRYVLELALAQDHTVTVLVRDPARLARPAGAEGARLRVVHGDVLDAASVAQVVSGAEAVLSVLGPTSNRPELAISRGIAILLDAMRQEGIRRLIQSIGAGVRDARDRPTPMHTFFGHLVRVLSRNVYTDMLRVSEQIRASDLDWTLVRVPMLTDGPATGHLRVGYVGAQLGPRLTRLDLATFMLRQLTDRTYLRQAPAVSN